MIDVFGVCLSSDGKYHGMTWRSTYPVNPSFIRSNGPISSFDRASYMYHTIRKVVGSTPTVGGYVLGGKTHTHTYRQTDSHTHTNKQKYYESMFNHLR